MNTVLDAQHWPATRRLRLAGSLTHVLEANAYRQRRAVVSPLEAKLRKAMARAFRAQARAFLPRFSRVRGLFAEVATPSDWEPLFNQAALETIQAFRQPLSEVTAKALRSGIIAAIGNLALDVDMKVDHPAAVDYVANQGAVRITQINETTRAQLRTIVTHAADEGWSYDRTARAIRARYAGFATERARNIAVYEVGAAYEEGNLIIARDLRGAGIAMQKAWSHVGDAKVRPDHIANAADGWIGLDDPFSSGDVRPPTDPRCRCTLLLRRRPDTGG